MTSYHSEHRWLKTRSNIVCLENPLFSSFFFFMSPEAGNKAEQQPWAGRTVTRRRPTFGWRSAAIALHRMDAQAPWPWAVLEMTTRGSVLVCTNQEGWNRGKGTVWNPRDVSWEITWGDGTDPGQETKNLKEGRGPASFPGPLRRVFYL